MEQKEKHPSGFHAFFRGIILFGFTMLLLSFILSGSISLFIAPKMMPFIYFAVASCFILSVVQIIRSTPQGQKDELSCGCEANHQMTGSRFKKIGIYSIFVLPLLMGFILPEKILDSSVAANRGVQLGAGVLSNASSDPNSSRNGYREEGETATNQNGMEQSRQGAQSNLNGPEFDSGSQALSSETEGVIEDEEESMDLVDQYLRELEEQSANEHITYDQSSFGSLSYYDELVQKLLEEEKIVVTDENYLDLMTVLDLYLEDLVGKQIEIMGFTYREYGMEQDEMVAARFAMTCCAADTAVYGLLVKSEETKQFEDDTWIKVQGTLRTAEFNDWVIPSIVADSIVEVAAPENPYVYPNY